MRRRGFSTFLAGSALAWPSQPRAQQPARVQRVGLLGSAPLRPIAAFRTRMRRLGYVEGRNVAFDARYAEGDDSRYPAFAAELVGAEVDLIVAWGTPAAFAAKRATTTIPVVLVAGDVVNTGLVSNLARPDGNITGFIALNVELEEKRLELLKELTPRLSRLAVLGNTLNPLSRLNVDTARRAAEKFAIAIDVFEVRGAREVEGALRDLVAARPDAALLASDTLLLSERRRIADAMAGAGIPAIYPFREYAEVGGLVVYGANISILFERVAEYADRILKGERPENLPVQQATAFELIVNLKAAKTLGLNVPMSILARADELIE